MSLSSDFLDIVPAEIETCSSFGMKAPKFSLIYFIEVKLIYNVVSVSGIQQSDSVIHIYNSLHLLIPNSHSILPPCPPPLATTSLFSRSVILFMLHR